MAEQDTKTDTQQNKQTAAQNRQAPAEMTRGSQQGRLARRGGDFPYGLSLTPLDIFSLNPFSLMRRISEEMDRTFGESRRGDGGSAMWSPAVEVSEQNGNYVVRAELPGLKPDQVRLEISDDALILQGERTVEREQDSGGVHRTELRYGQFYRAIPLPEGANAEQARAKFENGILEVSVPISEQQSRTRQIPIQSAQSAQSASTGGSEQQR
jgi:HSP20 family protein